MGVTRRAQSLTPSQRLSKQGPAAAASKGPKPPQSLSPSQEFEYGLGVNGETAKRIKELIRTLMDNTLDPGKFASDQSDLINDIVTSVLEKKQAVISGSDDLFKHSVIKKYINKRFGWMRWKKFKDLNVLMKQENDDNASIFRKDRGTRQSLPPPPLPSRRSVVDRGPTPDQGEGQSPSMEDSDRETDIVSTPTCSTRSSGVRTLDSPYTSTSRNPIIPPAFTSAPASKPLVDVAAASTSTLTVFSPPLTPNFLRSDIPVPTANNRQLLPLPERPKYETYLQYYGGTNKMEVAGVEFFLRSCMPSMIHFLPYFLEFGCKNLLFLKAASLWPSEDIEQEFLKKLPTSNGRTLTKMELLVLRKHLQGFQFEDKVAILPPRNPPA
ncbi:hypothetical protein FA15DRAFT_666028 [Coprinopsis marcescibilis]|uniref:Uncharacterized protein n=1 Tax=Coprinopsis marcescibilis TaxID=230819 RepID=A0A5C3L5A7_COPMA|nr:hypothetical protein FA15DRAFT_666028 [Coprinopsis marcescibilis]